MTKTNPYLMGLRKGCRTTGCLRVGFTLRVAGGVVLN